MGLANFAFGGVFDSTGGSVTFFEGVGAGCIGSVQSRSLGGFRFGSSVGVPCDSQSLSFVVVAAVVVIFLVNVAVTANCCCCHCFGCHC